MTYIELDVSGMSCISCAKRVENSLLGISGVYSVQVSFPLERAYIECHPNLNPKRLIEAIKKEGYLASQMTSSSQSSDSSSPAPIHQKQERKNLLRFLLSAFLSMLLVGGVFFLPYLIDKQNPIFEPLLQAVLCFAVMLISGIPIYRKAFLSIKEGRVNMALLLSLGVSTAFFSSLFQILYGTTQPILHFETAAMILTLTTLGEYLEARTRQHASSAVLALTRLQPPQAELIRAEESVMVDSSKLKPSDLVRVRPGKIIPCDGVIHSGQSSIDESLITGESMPVFRNPGDRVLTGTINGNGVLEITVLKTGKDTQLAQISRLVQDVQLMKIPIQKLVDRVSAIIAPIILCLSLITFFFWSFILENNQSALECMIAILVVSCPCALGLATPMALLAGASAAAKAGILICDLKAPEEAHNIDMIAFDKTGTLTIGHPVVQSVFSETIDTREMLALAASLEKQSEHPLARAFVSYTENLGIITPPVQQVEALPGIGVRGVVSFKKISVGNKTLVHHQEIPKSLIQKINEDTRKGKTLSFIVVDGSVTGAIAFTDPMRPEAPFTVDELLKRGIQSTMLTGDNQEAAETIAKQAHIDNIQFSLSPTQKAEEIKKLAQIKRVCFVGDGLNDAPALAASHLGIAFSSGVEAARNAASIVLMREDLKLVPATLDVLSRTRRVIKQNLLWAFIYNLIAIPLAASGLISPLLASVAMIFSSLSVITNSVFLGHWKPKIPEIS